MTSDTILSAIGADWRRVSRKYVIVELVGTVVSAVVFTALAGIWWLVSQWPWALVAPGAVLLFHLVYLAFTPRRVRAIGYALRDDDLLFRTGIMFTRVVAVPYGRMQLVDINRGPLARAVGISELKLVTAAAATNVTIPGLPAEEADALRDRLVELAETRRAGL